MGNQISSLFLKSTETPQKDNHHEPITQAVDHASLIKIRECDHASHTLMDENNYAEENISFHEQACINKLGDLGENSECLTDKQCNQPFNMYKPNHEQDCISKIADLLVKDECLTDKPSVQHEDAYRSIHEQDNISKLVDFRVNDEYLTDKPSDQPDDTYRSIHEQDSLSKSADFWVNDECLSEKPSEQHFDIYQPNNEEACINKLADLGLNFECLTDKSSDQPEDVYRSIHEEESVSKLADFGVNDECLSDKTCEPPLNIYQLNHEQAYINKLNDLGANIEFLTDNQCYQPFDIYRPNHEQDSFSKLADLVMKDECLTDESSDQPNDVDRPIHEKGSACKLADFGVNDECLIDKANDQPEDIYRSAITAPTITPLKIQQESVFLYFDLETGGLSRRSDILQLSAICSDGSSFNRYVTPTRPISADASEVHGLTCGNNQLFYNDIEVISIPVAQCLLEFIEYLKSRKPLVIGHNIRVFDCPILAHHLIINQFYDTFSQNILGFLDTLPYFKETFPEELSYKQENLVKNILGENYNAHNAIEDVLSLKKLIEKSNSSLSELEKFTFSTEFVKKYYEFSNKISENVKAFQRIINKKVLSKYMAEKIAIAGLKLKDLENAYSENGRGGIEKLLNDHVKVTTNKRIIQNICQELGE
ncbi:unnamed protein product [Meganyctiphanes norvegica]|uniref:Exonuclease domain-containing protein n=1 Tax=Meganyctiphanes norvegica TaxID=48144 RepID=A0AAV2SEE5_MEGNR